MREKYAQYTQREIENFGRLYRELGSTRKVAEHLNISKSTSGYIKSRYFPYLSADLSKAAPSQRLSREAELWFLERFGGCDATGFDDKCPYDILWNGLRVNIKASSSNEFTLNSTKRGRDCHQYCDLFVLCTMDQKSRVDDYYFLYRGDTGFGKNTICV